MKTYGKGSDLMNTLPTACPFCGGEIHATHLYCRECDTNIEGRFTTGASGPLKKEQLAFIDNFVARLNPEQLTFIETFVRCEGKMNRMEGELGISYPTIRNRLQDIIRALGFEPGKDEPVVEVSEDRRRQVLEDLDAGKLSADAAMRMLRGEDA
jgi:hypothetical protein